MSVEIEEEYPTLASVRAELGIEKPKDDDEPEPVKATEQAKEEPAKAEDPKVEPPKPDVDKESKAWAAIAKADKQNRKLAQEAKAQLAEAKRLAAEVAAKSEKKPGPNPKEDPLGYLKEAGLELEDVLRSAINDGKPTPELKEKLVNDKLAEYAKRLEDQQKKLDEYVANEAKAKQEREIQGRVAAFHQDIASHLSATPDDYALLNDLHGSAATKAVFDRIDSHYAETKTDDEDGEILSIKQAADLIESELLEELAARVPKLLPVLEKRGKYKFPVATPVAPAGKAAPAAKEKQTTTITNDIAASSPPATKQQSFASDEDEIEELVSELKRMHASKK